MSGRWRGASASQASPPKQARDPFAKLPNDQGIESEGEHSCLQCGRDLYCRGAPRQANVEVSVTSRVRRVNTGSNEELDLLGAVTRLSEDGRQGVSQLLQDGPRHSPWNPVEELASKRP